MNLRLLIKDYLAQTKLMQVATAVNNQPWACSVYFAYDHDFGLYWLSEPSTRHSQELKSNNQVAGAIVLPHTPGDEVRGLQFEGVAKELTEKSEASQGLQIYAKRFGVDNKRIQEILDGSDGHVCYKITPKLFVLFDQKNFPKNPRQEYDL